MFWNVLIALEGYQKYSTDCNKWFSRINILYTVLSFFFHHCSVDISIIIITFVFRLGSSTDKKMPRLCLKTSLSLQGSISNPNDIFDIVRGIKCDFKIVKRCKHIPLQIFVRNLFSFMRVYLSVKIHVSWIFTFIDFNCIFFVISMCIFIKQL